jgi:hypothetical protein
MARSSRLGQRDVGLGRNACTKGIIVRRQLRFGTARGSACGYFAGHAPPDQSIVNIGDADARLVMRYLVDTDVVAGTAPVLQEFYVHTLPIPTYQTASY